MKKPNWNPKVLYHGMCTLISDALSVISIVARDQVQKGSIDTLTPTKCGSENLDGVPLADKDKALKHAFILDTEGDVYTKMGVCCNDCGNELEVSSVDEQAEIAIILSVGACSYCTGRAHQAGYQTGSNDTNRGF